MDEVLCSHHGVGDSRLNRVRSGLQARARSTRLCGAKNEDLERIVAPCRPLISVKSAFLLKHRFNDGFLAN